MVGEQPRHPVLRAVADYWHGKCRGRPMPSRADLDPTEIPALLPHILLIDVAHDPLDFRYRLIGTAVDYHQNEPRTGQWLSAIEHQAPGSVIWTTLEAVVREKRPRTSSIPYVGRLKGLRLVEDIILPLSDDGERVSMLLIAAVFLPKQTD